MLSRGRDAKLQEAGAAIKKCWKRHKRSLSPYGQLEPSGRTQGVQIKSLPLRSLWRTGEESLFFAPCGLTGAQKDVGVRGTLGI